MGGSYECYRSSDGFSFNLFISIIIPNPNSRHHIDRLGSRNQLIQMVNFWAGKDLEGYLQLEARVKARMALVNATTIADENLLEHESEKKEKNYRDHQLLALKENVPELEKDSIQ